MGKRSAGSYWGYVLLAVGAIGCGSSTKDRCETACEWVKSCSDESVNCSDSELDECVSNYKGWSDDCQDAFDDFIDCVDDNDNKCVDIENECLEEAKKMVDKCGDET